MKFTFNHAAMGLLFVFNLFSFNKCNASSPKNQLGDNHTCEIFDIGYYLPVAGLNTHEIKHQLVICMVILVATLCKLLFHHTTSLSSHIPESCLLISVGLVLGLIIKNTGPVLQTFSPHEFFHYLLPPIILEAAFSLHNRVFFNNLGSILLYAVIGTVVSCLSLGYTLYGLKYVGAMGTLDVTVVQLLLFSALIVAVDPVAVLAVFQEISVNPVLYFLVFGESLLNDGVTVVLYKVLQEMNQMQFISGTQIVLAFVKFFVVCFGGLSVGVIFGSLAAIITRFTKHVQAVEPVMIFGFAYISHLVAELFDFSGIMSMISCGLVMVEYAFHNVTHKSRTTIKYFTKVMSGTSEIVIFLYLGLALVTHKHHWHTGLTVWTVFLCLLYRFIITYIISFVINQFDNYRTRKISLEEQFIISYGGLRGAVCFSLVALLDRACVPARDIFITTTLSVIMFTVFIQGITIKPIVKLLHIRLSSHHDLSLCQELTTQMTDHLMAGIEGIIGFHGKFRMKEILEHYNDKYLKKILQKNPTTADEEIQTVYEKIALKEHWQNLYSCNAKSIVDHPDLPDDVLCNDELEQALLRQADSPYPDKIIPRVPRRDILSFKELRRHFINPQYAAPTYGDKNVVRDESNDLAGALHRRRANNRVFPTSLGAYASSSTPKRTWLHAQRGLKSGGKFVNVVLKAHQAKNEDVSTAGRGDRVAGDRLSDRLNLAESVAGAANDENIELRNDPDAIIRCPARQRSSDRSLARNTSSMAALIGHNNPV